jgi:nitronate monooxygenase
MYGIPEPTDPNSPETARRAPEIYRSFLTDDSKLAVFLRKRPPVVSFHFGEPAHDLIEALRAAGIVLLAKATVPC